MLSHANLSMYHDGSASKWVKDWGRTHHMEWYGMIGVFDYLIYIAHTFIDLMCMYIYIHICVCTVYIYCSDPIWAHHWWWLLLGVTIPKCPYFSLVSYSIFSHINRYISIYIYIYLCVCLLAISYVWCGCSYPSCHCGVPPWSPRDQRLTSAGQPAISNWSTQNLMMLDISSCVPLKRHHFTDTHN